MIKVFFTASTTFNGTYKKNYQEIIKKIKNLGGKIISGKQIINEKLLEKDKKLTKKEIFQREKEKIDKADCLIAEVTHPSHGVGGEIVYGLMKKKPVLGLVFQDKADLISPMLEGNPSDNFFMERYNFQNLIYKIKNFLDYIDSIKNRQGKLVVIEGGNGSGKTTQTQLLINYLKNKKISYQYYDFPQYYTSFHGKTVAKFLRGELGSIDQVSPYLSSLAFALDRASVKKEMEDFLNRGFLIVANRYVSSSLAHQGAKFTNEKDKKEFLNWLYDLEYKVHKMPKEDLVIYLYVPWQISIKLSQKKLSSQKYLKGKKDIEEKDIKNRINSEKMYLELYKKNKHWVKIDCAENNKLLSPDDIHKKVIKILKEKNFIK